MPEPEIRFNQPTLEGREVEYIQEAVLGGHTSMNGPFAKQVTALLQDELDAAGVLLTTSCTHALEMCGCSSTRAGRRGHRPVVHVRLDAPTPSLRGGRPVFADIRGTR